MSAKSLVRKGRYLYAVVSGSEVKSYGFIGIDGGEVYLITDGWISAAVTDIPDERIRPQRRHIAAHQGVLARLMEEETPLPMRFGMIAEGTEAVTRLLSCNREAFLEQLTRLTGRVEMGLRVTWDVPNIFDYFVQTHSELRQARDRFFRVRGEPSREDKIELGRLFDRILNEDREVFTGRVEEVMSGYCVAFQRDRCRGESEVMNLACLVPRQEQMRFELGVFEAARWFDNNFAFDYNGPWAPYHFVDLELEL